MKCLTHQQPHFAHRIPKLKEAGFTLVELMITMAVFLIVIASASGIFTGLLTQFKQQSKISETNIEGIIGLDMLRRDIEHAGYGLPWIIPSSVAYNEAATTTYNDCSGTAPCNPPRAFVSSNNIGINGSDYLVIKSVNVARNSVSDKWTTLSTGNVKRTWTPNTENVNIETDGTTNNTVRVIVLSPGGASNLRTLVTNGSTFFTSYSNTAAFAPADTTTTNIIYGVDRDTDLRMPFNRADYSISTSSVPSKCATGTGVLTKTVISQANGGTTNTLPLLDCAASMQIIYQLDMNDDGTIDTQSKADGSLVTSSAGATVSTVQATLNSASLLRNRLKEVRVYVLAHEGQIDRTYNFNNFTAGACGTCVRVGEVFGGQNLGRDVNLTAITNYLNYRWKTYTLVVKPDNLK